jgi:ATP-dependent DNA helicase DinG
MSEWLKDPSRGLVRMVRPAQIAMAGHVQDVIENGGIAVIQAGTGTGKSFAYLTPAIEAGKRIVVATAKKNLQSQLFFKDLPHLAKIVKKVPFASLKGKNNYACTLRFDESRTSSYLDEFDPGQVERFAGWLRESPSADMGDFGEALAFEYHVRVGECLRNACPHHEDCGYLKTREAAKEAQILVVNHALLAHDLRLGGGKILGPYEVLILDEAHQAPKFFEAAFSHEFYERQAEHIERAFQHHWEIRVPSDLRACYRALFRTLERGGPGRFQLNASNERALVDLAGVYEGVLAQCKKHGLVPDASAEGVAPSAEESARHKSKATAAVTELDGLVRGVRILLGSHDEDRTEFVGFTEQKDRGAPMRLRVAPVEVGPLIAPALLHIGSVVITSATLQTGDGFGYYIRKFGLAPGQVRIQAALPSPFNYGARSTLWISPTIPLPAKDRSNKDAVLQQQAVEICELLFAMEGGAFVVCPSYSDMNALHDRVLDLARRAVGPDKPLPFKTLVQKGANVDGVIEEFKGGWHNVLFGVRAIAEGVDVPGLKLRLVIVTSLTFPHFEDVLNQAQKDLVRRRLIDAGENEKTAGLRAFDRVDVNVAGIELVQTAGRLIRTENDFGVLAVLDPRLHPGAKSYSNTLRRLLPHPTCKTKGDLMKTVDVIHKLALRAKQAEGA